MLHSKVPLIFTARTDLVCINAFVPSGTASFLHMPSCVPGSCCCWALWRSRPLVAWGSLFFFLCFRLGGFGTTKYILTPPVDKNVIWILNLSPVHKLAVCCRASVTHTSRDVLADDTPFRSGSNGVHFFLQADLLQGGNLLLSPRTMLRYFSFRQKTIVERIWVCTTFQVSRDLRIAPTFFDRIFPFFFRQFLKQLFHPLGFVLHLFPFFSLRLLPLAKFWRSISVATFGKHNKLFVFNID
mmetsp:Transcript_3243/g.6189  ORF Transcript_3243/g.6189 Transcript_3243/m.6189 type:complete len:241 (+) Transcript_3243:1012-1734(+)